MVSKAQHRAKKLRIKPRLAMRGRHERSKGQALVVVLSREVFGYLVMLHVGKVLPQGVPVCQIMAGR